MLFDALHIIQIGFLWRLRMPLGRMSNSTIIGNGGFNTISQWVFTHL